MVKIDESSMVDLVGLLCKPLCLWSFNKVKLKSAYSTSQTNSSHHEFEVRIGKVIGSEICPEDHHLAYKVCQVMTKDVHKGWNLLSRLYSNNGLFSSLSIRKKESMIRKYHNHTLLTNQRTAKKSNRTFILKIHM